MAQQKDTGIDIAETYGSVEKFINENRNIITGIGIGIFVVAAVLVYYFRMYLPDIETEAQTQIHYAEAYFANDSLGLALHGDGANPGFLEIIQDYKGTKTAKLARFYAGIALIRQGDFQGAIEHLKKFKSNDTYISTLAYSSLGDAYMELGQIDKAVPYFEKAANNKVNELITPIYLLKAGLANEKAGKISKAKSLYERIKKEYPNSEEGKVIDKYISRAEARL